MKGHKAVTKYFRNFLMGMVLLLASSFAFCQATLPSTILTAAITSSRQDSFTVSSATNFAAGYFAVVDQELMYVKSVSSTRISVIRGYSGTRATTHANSSYIYVGPSNYFIAFDQSGTCTATNEVVLPQINYKNGKAFDCTSSGSWLEIGGSGGTYVEAIFCGDLGNSTTLYDSPISGYPGGNFYTGGLTANDLDYSLAGTGCAAEDNATEATADEVMFANNDVYVVGLVCAVNSSGSNGVALSLRDDTAELTPAYSVTIATTKTTVSSSVRNIIKIAAGSTVALKTVTTENLSASDNWCVARLQIAP
jgi:hypothetical protein